MAFLATRITGVRTGKRDRIHGNTVALVARAVEAAARNALGRLVDHHRVGWLNVYRAALALPTH